MKSKVGDASRLRRLLAIAAAFPVFQLVGCNLQDLPGAFINAATTVVAGDVFVAGQTILLNLLRV